MTTTKEAFAGQRQGNYCTLPKIDVEILPDVLLCRHCRQEIVHVDVPLEGVHALGMAGGIWVHADDPRRLRGVPSRFMAASEKHQRAPRFPRHPMPVLPHQQPSRSHLRPRRVLRRNTLLTLRRNPRIRHRRLKPVGPLDCGRIGRTQARHSGPVASR